MKPIKIRHFCRLPILMIFAMCVCLPLMLLLLILGIKAQNGELCFIGGVLLLIFAVGMYFYCTYGIKITNKKVHLRYYNAFKTFRYEDINYIKIGFNDHSIWGEIKCFREKPYSFVFVDFVGVGYGMFSSLMTTRVKITKRKAEKILKDLSQCEKVRIENRFEE